VAAQDRIERIIQDLHTEREQHPELNDLVEPGDAPKKDEPVQ
jgi:hypothetical protein